MATIDVTLDQDVGSLAKDAESAARGMAKLAAQEERIKKIHASELAKGVARDPKKIAAGLKIEEAAQAKIAKAAEAAKAKAAKQEAARQAKIVQQQKLGVTNSKKFAEQIGKLKSGNLTGLGAAFGSTGLAAGLAASAVVAIGVAAIAAGIGVAALVAKIAALGVEASKARNESQGLLAIYAGNDPKLVARLAAGFDALGISLEEGTKKFETLRKAGLTTGQAFEAIRLSADVKAISKSSAAGEVAFANLTDAANELKSKLQGVTDPKLRAKYLDEYNARLARMREQAGTAGTGLDAATAKATTFEGALFRLNAVKTKALETIGDRVSPSLDRLGSKVASMVEKFVASETGQKAIQAFSDVVVGALNGVGHAIDFLVANWGEISKVIGYVTTGFKVFGAVAAVALLPVLIPVAVVGAAITALGAIVVGTGYLIGAAIDKIPGYFSSAYQAVTGFMDRFYEGGIAIVDGLVNGIKAGAIRLYDAVVGLARGALDKFKATLGIASPSKVFAIQGQMVGLGAEQGIRKSTPGVVASSAQMAAAVAEPVVNAPSLGSDTRAAPAAPSPVFGAPAATTGPSITFSFAEGAIQISGSDGAAPDETMRSMRRELEAMARNLLLQIGSQ